MVQNRTLWRGKEALLIIYSLRKTELCGQPVYKGDDIHLNKEMSARNEELFIKR